MFGRWFCVLFVLSFLCLPVAHSAYTADDYYNYGNQMMSSGDAAQAKVYYEYALKLDPNHWQAWQGLGSSLVQTGQKGEALVAFVKSLTIYPDNPQLREYMKSAGLSAAQPAAAKKPAAVEAPAVAMPPPLKRRERRPVEEKSWQKRKRWLSEILLQSIKKGKKKKKVCYKWAATPTLSVIGGSASQQKLVRQAVFAINRALQGTGMQIDQVGDDDESAKLLVYIAQGLDFDLIAQKHGFQMQGYSAYGVSLKWYDRERYLISKAVVFLAEEKGPDELKWIALSSIARSLGFRHEPPAAPLERSVFYIPRRGRKFIEELSFDDKAILRFLYTVVRPGCEKKELEELFEKYYPEPPEE